MILAEELDADWSRVKLEHAPPDEALYGNPMLRHSGDRQFQLGARVLEAVAQAAAGARAMLVQAARADGRWDRASMRTQDSQVIHDASGRKLAYAALIGAASALTPPADPPAEGPEGFSPDRPAAEAARHAGQGQRQGVQYGIDALPPG
jgi:isoquinoline 1-oxidoreductase subunit beta